MDRAATLRGRFVRSGLRALQHVCVLIIGAGDARGVAALLKVIAVILAPVFHFAKDRFFRVIFGRSLVSLSAFLAARLHIFLMYCFMLRGTHLMAAALADLHDDVAAVEVARRFAGVLLVQCDDLWRCALSVLRQSGGRLMK